MQQPITSNLFGITPANIHTHIALLEANGFHFDGRNRSASFPVGPVTLIKGLRAVSYATYVEAVIAGLTELAIENAEKGL